MTEQPRRSARSRRRIVLRGHQDLRRRRQQMYRAVAPVFRALGYRGATMKALARACGLSIPGLYRYFPAKRALAMYPLSPANQPGPDCFETPSADPLGHLRIWIEHGAVERADYLIALSLLPHLPERDRPSHDELRQCFSLHERLLSSFMERAACGLSSAAATEAAQAMLAVSFGRDVILVERSVAEMRAEFIRLARDALVPAGVDAARLDAVMTSPPPPHSCTGPCA